ncbi:MAG: 1-deoxy-D-xylulose-5-phosphate reductoisomerase [Lachnospiraceae bacterium]|nr:1-deoxy-D-xylulose-5-phosphate reductoisomerase [Lachnospiraceae bacterium]
MKYLSILGSTGSIGTQTLDIVRAMPDRFRVASLAAAGSRADLLGRQIAEFRPALVAVYDPSRLEEVKAAARTYWQKEAQAADSPVSCPSDIEFVTGMEGLIQCAGAEQTDIVVTSLVGMIGIRPTMAAIQAGKDIALANKETLVCAGELIMKAARDRGVRILPVDSEHGAIFQCMQGVPREDVTRIWLTASGGPFRGCTRQQLEKVTLAQALKHPNWSMGAKITIDSATLMNKGLEMIEARWLFDMKPEEVVPIVHPQSIVHSMIEVKDGSVLAQLGAADMRLPIEVALCWPERGKRIAAPLDFRNMKDLTFSPVDEEAFPSVAMARHAMQTGGLLPAVFNAANEAAVAKFRREEIGFTDIFRLVEKAMTLHENTHPGAESYTLEDVLYICESTEKQL